MKRFLHAVVSIAVAIGSFTWGCGGAKRTTDDIGHSHPVIYFWGLGALVVGKDRGQILFVNIEKTALAGHDQHWARLIVPRRALKWYSPGRDDGSRKKPAFLIPIGERETYAIWDIAGKDISIMGDEPGGVHFDVGNRAQGQVQPLATDQHDIGWLGSPKCVNAKMAEISSGCASLRQDIYGTPEKDLPGSIIAARVTLTQGKVDALIADTQRIWGFDHAQQPAARSLKEVGQQQALASVVRFTHKDVDEMTLCVGPCNSSGSRVVVDPAKGAVTVVNYPIWDLAAAGTYDGNDDSPPDPEKALIHFAAYYDLVADAPTLALRPVPYRLTTGIPIFALDGGLRTPPVHPPGPQSPPNCTMARLDEPTEVTRTPAPAR